MLKAVKGNKIPIWRGVDYTGKKIGNWTVLRYASCLKRDNSKKNYEVKWTCQCSCGVIHDLNKYNLTSGKTSNCVSCTAILNTGNKNRNWKGHKDISGCKLYRVLNGAKTRGILLEISIEDLQDLWEKQEGVCALSGLVLDIDKDASVDRIDSSLGYTKDNIQWIHKHINHMKNKYDQDYFLSMCKLITEHTK